MALDVTTKDCTALSDSELAELADLCADGGHGYEVGALSKQVDQWVLVTLAKEGSHLRGFSFSTLERIGGAVHPHRRRVISAPGVTQCRSIINDNFRRALMAFPDEDVLLGTRLSGPGSFEAFKALEDVVRARTTSPAVRSARGVAASRSASASTPTATTTRPSPSPVTAPRRSCSTTSRSSATRSTPTSPPSSPTSTRSVATASWRAAG